MRRKAECRELNASPDHLLRIDIWAELDALMPLGWEQAGRDHARLGISRKTSAGLIP